MSTQQKFQDMQTTAKGEMRASVKLDHLKTLWFNTGSLCNLSCQNCYIESSPRNDRLSYITKAEVRSYLDEIDQQYPETKLIGLTGGEPFLNPSIIEITELILSQDLEVLILTNAHKVLKRHQQNLLRLKDLYADKLHLRVSLDHHRREVHERERGEGTFEETLSQLKWLSDHRFNLSVAGRALLDEPMDQCLKGYQELFDSRSIDLDVALKCVVFPEMKPEGDVPEITTACWGILGVSPQQMMCSSERMIVKRKGEDIPVVMPCTLLAYDPKFILGTNLKEAQKNVFLNHKFCAQFCVLGGASCSSTK